ncbi:uncharacterized protein N7484_010989 [Penicillium longicatenatum]|uniref:uncharacterized protein n=1 Tax=Penicillium longicatenatum TaxID=1561947 RepID=UPI0025484029|nr:uncharacterized protein N7484_010989 [Penicillium longicatenatum]KAJ5630889.1 hypothetical protein N7484_010989 [Penicillium longicatenatum]
MDGENTTQSRASTRSRIPQAGGLGLRDMNSATVNSRSGIMPPGTLVNKALSPTRSRTIPSPSPEPKKQPSVVRPSSTTSKAHARGNSFASSTMSRSGSTTTRGTTPNFSATVGYGARGASAMPRPATSYGGRRLNSSIQRPATSLDTHIDDSAGSVLGKRKGMPSVLSPSSILRSFSGPLGSLDGLDGSHSYYGVPQLVSAPGFTSLSEGFLEQPVSRSIVTTARVTNIRGFPGLSPAKQAYPSRVPIITPSKPCETPLTSPGRSPKKPRPHLFLSKNSLLTNFDHVSDTDWDQDSREKSMNDMMAQVMSRLNQQGHEASGLKDTVELYKSRIGELERSRDKQADVNVELRVEMESLKNQLALAEKALNDARRDQDIAMDDLEGRHRIEIESLSQDNKKQQDTLVARHQEEIRDLKRKFEGEIEDEKAKRVRDLGNLTTQSAMDVQKSQIELNNKEREISTLRSELNAMKADIDRERKTVYDLRQNLDIASSNGVTLESTIRALKARIEFLEGGREEQSQAFERCNQDMMDALAETDAIKEKLRREETLRRKLHNQVQELKGNIRVFCRVRPSLNNEPASMIAPMQYPDEFEDAKEINVLGPEEKSSLGTISRKNNTFSFDRVFGPSTQNAEVFDEISQLVQSALDGYNVCIFCYGQTGSGKTHTMSSRDGMIPRAVHQIYETAQGLEEKGWRYKMEGNFVEVYNENLNDLLGNPDELDKKKHDIRHDMQRGKTIITDITTVQLDSPEMVETILRNADANRSVAATKANERSSRSHSVFILKLTGENHITGERSEGTLNLVDLAGSERLSHSGATGERLKETQNINRSLSSLGDVIAALGQGKDGGHIPYRNSKLTYLLQFSLGGNSKTLMFVMASPLQAHLSETLTSLKFATKVHNTHIGTAKRQARVRD